MRKVILAGIEVNGEREFTRNMAECKELCKACNMEVVCEITQQARSIDPATAFRSGKMEELIHAVEETGAEEIVFYNRLPFAPTSAIAEATGIPVMDRTALILEIFSKRARSKQAKLQVEAARLQYALPRLVRSEQEEETHQRGGSFNNRGGGEMRAAILKKRYQGRIADLKKELKKIEVHETEQKAHRRKSRLGKVALVGYTNAGKSSLMNAITALGGKAEKTVEAKDMLFATLDTSIRSITFESRSFLLYDTVGFVSNLPHELVEAFRSTLAAAVEADLLIEVIDSSEPDWQDKASVTEKTLQDIHAGSIPMIRVFNKADRMISDPEMSGIHTSCVTQEGIEKLIRAVEDKLYPAEETIQVHIPYADLTVLNANRHALKTEILQEEETGWTMRLSGPKENIEPLKHFQIKEEIR